MHPIPQAHVHCSKTLNRNNLVAQFFFNSYYYLFKIKEISEVCYSQGKQYGRGGL